MTLQNFVLLESEHDHTGANRTGPLAMFTENFKGHDYFHIRRVYRDNANVWRATSNGISCRADLRDAMLSAVLKALQANGTLAKPGARGLHNGKAAKSAENPAENPAPQG